MAKSPSLLSEIRFGAYLVYSPYGKTETSRKSKDVCLGIKNDRPGYLASTVRHLAEHFRKTRLTEVLGRDVALVPAPRSALMRKGDLWPAKRIAHELVKVRLGREVVPCVTRVKSVPKAAWTPPSERPTARTHLDSLDLTGELGDAKQITVVDDVITRGAMLLAVVSLLKTHHPDAEIWGFAMVRTMSGQEVGSNVAPVLGSITLDLWGTSRVP